MEQPPVPTKTWELSLYELHRTPQEAITDNTEIAVSPRSLHSELMCPICLDMLKNTMTTKECLHRFCQECIITALRSGNKECPTCRKKLVSKRSLRPDPNFDALISKIYPSRDEYEAHQERVLAKLKQAMNPAAMTQNFEEALRQQALSRPQRMKKHGVGGEDEGESRGGGVEESGETSMDQGESSSSTGMPVVPPEIELVFKPHPHDGDGGQSRYIKTTANATIGHLAKYLAMRIALEKQKVGVTDTSALAATPDDAYQISAAVPGGAICTLARDLSLQHVKDKYWRSVKPVELFYTPLDKRKESG